MNYILDKIVENEDFGSDDLESILLFLHEYDYATKYLSKNLKVRTFTVYMMLFKKAFFELGSSHVQIKLEELGQYHLSDQGNPMSRDIIKRGLNDLVHLGIIERDKPKPGQITTFTVKLPSDMRQVKEQILAETDAIPDDTDDSTADYYTVKEKRLEILERDEYKCFYCLCALTEDDYFIDHILPRSEGGRNYQSNLISSCRACNSKKSDSDARKFLLLTYRAGLIEQSEYLAQKDKLERSIKIYESVLESA